MARNSVILYKYISRQYLMETLRNQQLYLDDGSNFNDPFELLIVSESENNDRRVQGLHILCLTNSYRKKLMWSYYGESHKGVCLTIEVPKKIVYPVCYTSERVYENSNLDEIIAHSNINMRKNTNCDYSTLSTEKKIAFIKDKKWKDEREYRIVLDGNDEKLLTNEGGRWFLKVKIKNVYLGARFADNGQCTASAIEEICKEKRITVKYMTLSRKNYGLDIAKERKLP